MTTLVHHYLERSAACYPHRIALTDGRNALTFARLNTAANQIAGFLAGRGIGRGERVVYFLRRSLDCVVATLGIAKSGAAYVPLDQKTPPERWHRIVTDSTPRALLCHAATLDETLERRKALASSPPVICLEPVSEPLPADVFVLDMQTDSSPVPLQPVCFADDPAYVLYTSGSTGAPKGVIVTHGNITNYIDWALAYFDLTVSDRILGTAPFHFDMSTFDIYCALGAGATLCIASDDLLLFPEVLVRFMEQQEITVWKGVSSLLMYLCRAGVLRPGRLPALRTVIFAGEPLDARYLRQWMETFPRTAFYNGYGPTEATGISLCYHVQRPPEPGEPIPIGKPCKGGQALLLDENDQPVPQGAIGELCLAGDGLAKGYLNDPQKTDSRFTPPPPGCAAGDRIYRTGDLCRQLPDGNYVFVSRKDHQVKWMGYRIELGEIETHLMACEQVKAAVVLLLETQNGLKELAAFVESEEEINPCVLSAFLEKRVPYYMLPRRFIRVKALPRNDRGKIDRQALLELEMERV
ncbi:MAG: amino acid adenylation domain-containing protein [Anaerolineales bacterium]|nr:amino acid adenylation domain-containing protein [Anaerolineales bacterium]MDW8279173.1 amino acid adenylation domain-containing protein [Anaerolineales bacterium]